MDKYHQACSTAQKREALFDAIQHLASRYGAEVSSHKEPREIFMCLSVGPYRVTMDFSGFSKVGAFLGHWFTVGDAKFPKNFGVTIGGTINEFHYEKATSCESNFDDFLVSLEDGLLVCKDL